MIRLAATLALMTATAAPALAQKGPTPPPMQARMSAVTYARMAGASDTYEKESSQLILATAQNPEVRRFAEMMVADHAQTTAALLAGVRDASISAAPRLLDKQTRMMKTLRRTPEDRRERVYMDQQVMAHQEALALHEGYAATGDNASLRAAAQAAVPVVRQHLAEAERIRATLR
jgi:putative membrane protein